MMEPRGLRNGLQKDAVGTLPRRTWHPACVNHDRTVRPLAGQLVERGQVLNCQQISAGTWIDLDRADGRRSEADIRP